MSKRALLSIDGGGIRGIIPLCALAELERQTQRPARDWFSYVAGTSTGAIIAGGIACGLSAEQMLELYQTLGPNVFRFDLFGFLTSLASFRYRSKPLAELLQIYYDDVTLNDLPIDIMVTATRVSDGKPWYFVRDNACNSSSTGSLRLVDCVTASAAAPTFFEPYDVPGIGACVDGGVGIAGNPVYQTCVEAFYYSPQGTYTPSDTVVVSLGTGYSPKPAAPRHLLEWVTWIIGELLAVPAEQQTELVLRHFTTAGTYRINPPLPRDIGMDDVSAVPELITIGRELAANLDWDDILAGKPALQVRPNLAWLQRH
ncbi:MAG: patatin-like phospholipase family protein [Chloroflexi bacterium]|nr:patatin-like phospholipase family protein [Chloroflexota bacterium]